MSHILWHDVDEARLQYGFELGRSIPDMAMMLERSVHAIIGHLKTLELISEDEATAYFEKYPKDAQSD